MNHLIKKQKKFKSFVKTRCEQIITLIVLGLQWEFIWARDRDVKLVVSLNLDRDSMRNGLNQRECLLADISSFSLSLSCIVWLTPENHDEARKPLMKV